MVRRCNINKHNSSILFPILAAAEKTSALLIFFLLVVGALRKGRVVVVSAEDPGGIIISSEDTVLAFRHHAYQLVTEHKTWFEAKNYAATQQYCGVFGYLTTITTQAENDFIHENLASNMEVWIGLNDRDDLGNTENSFGWYNNETVDYLNFWSNQPDGDGDCIQISAYLNGGKWNDINCGATTKSIIEYDCPLFDLDLNVINVNISLTTNTDMSKEAISIDYNYTGARPNEDIRVHFTYDILQDDCNTEYALATSSNTATQSSSSLYFTAFDYLSVEDDDDDEVVRVKLGMNLTTIEDSDEIWIHPNDDETKAVLSFCGRFNIYVNGQKFQFHETNVTAIINLKEDGGFNVDSYNVGLDRDDAMVRNENVDVSFPVNITVCDDDADSVAPDSPQVFHQGTPIQICLEIQTPSTFPAGGGGVFLQGINNLTYSATLHRDHFCSSAEQSLTFGTGFAGWVNQGGNHPIVPYCEAICRSQPDCKTWMWRNSATQCYTSSNPALFDENAFVSNVHHQFFFGPEYCNPPVQKYHGDPIALISDGTMQYGSTAMVDCGQKAGVCRVKFLADAGMYMNAGHDLVIEGMAVVAFGMDPDRRHRQTAFSQESGGSMRRLEDGEEGDQLTPFRFTVGNFQPSEEKKSLHLERGMLVLAVVVGAFAVFVLIAGARAAACFKCRCHQTTNSLTDTVAAGKKSDHSKPTESCQDGSLADSHDETNELTTTSQGDDDKYEIVEL